MIFIALLILFLSESVYTDRSISFNFQFTYDCTTPTCDGHYVISSPFKLTVEGINVPIENSCELLIGKGYGKGQHLSVFLYRMISRFHSTPMMSRINEVFVDPPHDFHFNHRDKRWWETNNGYVFHNGRWVLRTTRCPPKEPVLGQQPETTTEPPSSGDSIIDRPFQSEHSINLCEKIQPSETCPAFCFECYLPRKRFNQLYQWKNSDGSTCMLPNFMKGNAINTPGGNEFPVWISKFKYLYLSNAEHIGNPCYLKDGDKPDTSMLQCKQPPPPPKPCPTNCLSLIHI